MDRKRIGKEAEQRAEQFLLTNQLRLIERNYTCRFGEIDLIMLDQHCLVFIEVRHRKYQGWGGAVASVDYRKQQKIIRSAQHFLTTHQNYSNSDCRFDVIAFEAGFPAAGGGDSAPIWYKDAFRL